MSRSDYLIRTAVGAVAGAALVLTGILLTPSPSPCDVRTVGVVTTVMCR